MRTFDEFKTLMTKAVQPGKKEVQYYPVIKALFAQAGWTAFRLESKLQLGLPDFLCVRFGEVLFAEVKVFRGKTSPDKCIFEQLCWQPGQIGFLTTLTANNIPFVLAIIAEKELTLYANKPAKKCLCKP